MCCIAVVQANPTLEQQGWYTGAEAYCWVQKAVTRWRSEEYTIMCLSRGQQAAGWAQAVLHAIDRLNHV